MNLKDLGWNSFFAESFESYKGNNFIPGRISSEQKNYYRVYTETGELIAQISGKLRYSVNKRCDLPAVGDWVVLTENQGTSQIHAVLPRNSKFSRKAAGTGIEEQIVAANVDTVFLVSALNSDFNLRRLERYLVLAWESGAYPVIVLSKADLCSNVQEKCSEVAAVAPGVAVVAVSTVSDCGLQDLNGFLSHGSTVAFLGSSGVGKSSLVNILAREELQRTQEIRIKDDKGKHTTTSRELLVLPGRGLLLDTPGMRELQLWGTDSGLNEAFTDIDQLALNCYFSNCTHQQEPGCAVRQALSEGQLAEERFNSYEKLQRELAYLTRKENQQAAREEKAKWKKINKYLKQQKRH